MVVYQVKPEQYSPFAKAEKVLRRLPGIEEPERGVFRIAGNQQNARILIDGVEATQMELENLDAQEIVRVETKVLSGRNTEGYEGEINIIRQRVKRLQFKGESRLGALLHPPKDPGGLVRQNLTLRTPWMDLVANGRYIPNVQSIESETWRGGTRILRTERRNLLEQFDAQGRANFFFTPRLKTSLMYSLFGANRHQTGRWIRPSMADEKFRQRNLDRLQRGDAIAIWEVADHHSLEAQFQVFEYHTRNYIPGYTSAASTLLSYHGRAGYEFDSLRLFWLTHDVEVGGELCVSAESFAGRGLRVHKYGGAGLCI